MTAKKRRWLILGAAALVLAVFLCLGLWPLAVWAAGLAVTAELWQWSSKRLPKLMASIHRKLGGSAREREECPVNCPKCGSTQVYAGKSEWNWTANLVGSGLDMTCAKCGHRFKEGGTVGSR
jgi:hypothetical protein